MRCQEIFSKRIAQNLDLLSEHLANTYGVNSSDLIPLISNYIKFNDEDHIGGFVPLYYNCGLPCRTWVCVTCRRHIKEKNNIFEH